MKILFDQGTPVPLRKYLAGHEVKTAHEMGWDRLSNGDLLQAADGTFELLITTDQGLQYQQNLAGRSISIIALPTTSWPVIERHSAEVVKAVEQTTAGGFLQLSF